MKNQAYLILSLCTLLITFFAWSLFHFQIPAKIGFPASSIETVFSNYDGPNYLVITKCGYNPECIRSNFSLPQPLEYYPAHLPGYPRFIGLLDTFLPGPYAMLLTTLLGSLLLSLSFYYLARLYLKENTALWLSIIFIVFPARLFVLRLVGAPETWFLALTVLSIIYYKKNNFLLSAVMAAAAQTFKSPGVLLFLAYGILSLHQLYVTRRLFPVLIKYSPYLLVPLAALLVFYSYYLQTGDFLAYFNSGDNFHLNPLPYLVFISNRTWIHTIWLEDIIYILLFSIYGLSLLWKKYRFDIITLYTFIFILATTLVAHRDISRYIAPVYPFLLIAFHRHLTKPGLKLTIILLIPAILLYSINFIIGNTAPVADWGPYL